MSLKSCPCGYDAETREVARVFEEVRRLRRLAVLHVAVGLASAAYFALLAIWPLARSLVTALSSYSWRATAVITWVPLLAGIYGLGHSGLLFYRAHRRARAARALSSLPVARIA